MNPIVAASTTEALTNGVTAFVQVASSMLTTVTANPILMVFFSASLAFTGVALVRKLKN